MTNTQRNLLALLAITADILCIGIAAKFGVFPALVLYFFVNIIPIVLFSKAAKQSD